MLPGLFADQVTIVTPIADISDGQGGVIRSTAATANSQVVTCRIEPRRGRDEIVRNDAGDVASATHIAFFPPAVILPDGSYGAPILIPTDSHIIDAAGTDYLVVAPIKTARIRDGSVDHLEADLRVLAGAI